MDTHVYCPECGARMECEQYNSGNWMSDDLLLTDEIWGCKKCKVAYQVSASYTRECYELTEMM